MNRSGPGLYKILTLYWYILRRIHCSLCDRGSWSSDAQYSTQYVHLASPTQAHSHLHVMNPVKLSIPVEGF